MSENTTYIQWMRRALELAAMGRGCTSPNPMVGAILVDDNNQLLGEGWHKRAGEAHAEINALDDAHRRGNNPQGSTLYVTLEPCSTQGRTGPCVEAIIKAGIRRVICSAVDPNPKHQGRGLEVLRAAGIEVVSGILEEESKNLNCVFNHWIIQQIPFVTLKSSMSLDGKIATATGESKWITGAEARAHAMLFRAQADAILTGVNTVLADNCALTVRSVAGINITHKRQETSPLRRIILDSKARTPLDAQVVSDQWRSLTTIVVTASAPKERVQQLREQVQVWCVESDSDGHPLLLDVLRRLGSESVSHLLVEAGGTLSESFLHQRLVQRIHFYYAPKIIGGKKAPSGVGGQGIHHLSEAVTIVHPEWTKLGADLLLSANVVYPGK